MSPTLGLALYTIGVWVSIILLLCCLIWSFALGSWKNRRSSGNRDCVRSTVRISGTASDTINQLGIEVNTKKAKGHIPVIEQQANSTLKYVGIIENVIKALK